MSSAYLNLIISIFCSTGMIMSFKEFEKRNIALFPAILVNYLVTSALALFFSLNSLEKFVSTADIHLILLGIFTGVMFIIIFNLTGKSTAILGGSVSATIQRVSLIIPTIFAAIYYGEAFTRNHIFGVLLVLISIYLIIFLGKEKKQDQVSKKDSSKILLYSLACFFGVGFSDVILKIAQQSYMGDTLDPAYITMLFPAALLTGLITLLFRRKDMPQFRSLKTWIGGLVLGCFNYASLYFFLMAMSSGNIPGTQLFPINSIGIIVLSTLLAILIYKEKINKFIIAGIAVAIAAIVLITSA